MTPHAKPGAETSTPRIEARPGDRFAIVVSRYHGDITGRLLVGARETFQEHGVSAERVRVEWVPGAFELPLAALKLAQSGRYVGIVCLGAVIQGETQHHDYINHQSAAGIMQAGLLTGVPVAFGVLTCPSLELALDRAGGKAGNKGAEAALAALEMAQLLRNISE
jgi:6,7-dimethyl-8-ribityllumazine synthase